MTYIDTQADLHTFINAATPATLITVEQVTLAGDSIAHEFTACELLTVDLSTDNGSA
jgi:hypothetical protein